MILPGTPPSSDSPNRRCPHLGLRDDPETALGFSSNWNYCHNVKPITIPNLDHQQTTCLTTKHTLCPAFHAEQKKTLPKDLRMRKLRGGHRKARLFGYVGLILFFLIASGSGLIFFGYWNPVWLDKLPVSEWINRTVPGRTATDVPIMETETPEKIIRETVTVPAKNTASSTQTEPVFTNSCAYPLETPIGTKGQFLIHRVAHGENMILLAEHYQTTAEVMDTVNYFLPSPLWAEQVIVIPLNTTETDGLTSLKPVFIDKDDISLDELAESLSISLPDLLALNQQDLSCRSFHGWILIPAERKTP